MFWFTSKKRTEELEEKTQKGFNSVKEDIEKIGKWIKHLDEKDKQVFNEIYELKKELSSLKEELFLLREGENLSFEQEENKQVFKKLPVLDKQTAVEDVGKVVQTAVQTDNFYEILNGLSANERLLVLTLANSDMKLSYEDLALLLGKERSTVRGQINSIKQKSESLIEEIAEKNGKKRVFVRDEVKRRLEKYAKVRTRGKKKGGRF